MYFTQICLGLKHCHDNKILHRDIKSPNIFLTENGHIKIGDFGLSRILRHTMDMTQAQLGTQTHMAPEIFNEEPYRTKADIWALGVVLYQMATL